MTNKLKWWQRKDEQDTLRAAMFGACVALLWLAWMMPSVPEPETPLPPICHRHNPEPAWLTNLEWPVADGYVVTDEFFLKAGRGTVVIHQNTGNVDFRGECDLNLAAWNFWRAVSRNYSNR